MAGRAAVARVALQWLVFAALYLAFAGNLSKSESVTAITAGLLVSLYRTAILRFGRPFTGRWVEGARLLPHIAASVAKDVMAVGMAYAESASGRRRLAGRFADVPFDPGKGGASGRSRRGLVIAGISFSPNTYVVAVRHPAQKLTRHELLPAPRPTNAEWPL